MLEQWLASILRHMETDPGYLDTLPQLPQVILKNEASSRFWRGEAFSHALEILRGWLRAIRPKPDHSCG